MCAGDKWGERCPIQRCLYWYRVQRYAVSRWLSLSAIIKSSNWKPDLVVEHVALLFIIETGAQRCSQFHQLHGRKEFWADL